MNTFIPITVISSVFALALIFQFRPDISKEVQSPTRLFFRVANRVLLTELFLSLVGFFLVARMEFLFAWSGFFFFCYVWMHTIYLLCFSTAGSGKKEFGEDNLGKPKRSLLERLCVLVAVLAYIDFASFFCLTEFAGGFAKRVENGRFLLWHQPPDDSVGHCIEVSQFTYTWLLWQMRSLMIVFPGGLLAGYLLRRLKRSHTNDYRKH